MELGKLIPVRRRRGGVCILGPTSSGRVLLENLRANGKEVLCFVDPQGKFRGESWAGVPVVKLESQDELPRLKRLGVREFAIVSGATVARRRLYLACEAAGLKPITLIHPTATVLSDSTLGPGCVIGARALVGVGAKLEEDCLVGMGSLLDHDCRLGPHVTLGSGATFGPESRAEECAFIGDGVVLLAGRTIGKNAIVISGSVVTQDIPPDSIAAGVPAKLIRRRT